MGQGWERVYQNNTPELRLDLGSSPKNFLATHNRNGVTFWVKETARHPSANPPPHTREYLVVVGLLPTPPYPSPTHTPSPITDGKSHMLGEAQCACPFCRFKILVCFFSVSAVLALVFTKEIGLIQLQPLFLCVNSKPGDVLYRSLCIQGFFINP